VSVKFRHSLANQQRDYLNVHFSRPRHAPWRAPFPLLRLFSQHSIHSFKSLASPDRRWQRPYCPGVSRFDHFKVVVRGSIVLTKSA